MTGYTVVDVETTGLFPEHHDRIVEIAIVYMSDTAQVQGEWSSLINPGRDVGPVQLHGIAARDVLDAPTFADIAVDLIRSMTGRTLVGHNIRFDTRFLDAEFQRTGLPITPPTPGLCTMQWSNYFLHGASRKLVDCCTAAGVPHDQAHSALGDARATAGLLAYFLTACRGCVPWSGVLDVTRGHRWPPADSCTAKPEWTCARQGAGAVRPAAWLDRITSNMPRNDDPVVEAYLEVLERAMLDRYLSAHEEQALIQMAVSLGLQRDQLTAIHATYLDALAATALEDGVVTETELHELHAVARMLGLPSRLVDVALDHGSTGQERAAGAFRLVPGDQVVFTGDMHLPRAEWVARAERAGLACGGVTKKTKLVVAADPDSQSGKAAKARAYNIPVVNEASFERLLAELEPAHA